jgi:hypothetical protein
MATSGGGGEASDPKAGVGAAIPATGGGSQETDSMEEMMRKMKLTAAEADRLLDDEEEDPGKVVWAIAGKILAPTPKVFHINTISAALKPLAYCLLSLFTGDRIE